METSCAGDVATVCVSAVTETLLTEAKQRQQRRTLRRSSSLVELVLEYRWNNEGMKFVQKPAVLGIQLFCFLGTLYFSPNSQQR